MLFVRIRAQKSEFFNEMADQWADQCVLATDSVRWNRPSLRLILSWKVGDKLHRGTMSTGVKARVDLMVAQFELPKHVGKMAAFLKKENHWREILGLHWADKGASIWAKRRLLQCTSHQFPCAMTFKLWGMWENDECRLCRRLKPESTVDTESLGHIQCHCKTLP